MEVYKEKIANDEREVLHFSKARAFIHLVGNSKITITKNAISDLISDMDRTYETAGLLLGHSENGKIVFDKYVKDHSVKHRGDMFVQKDSGRELKDLKAYYAKEGFNAVVFVHLHPNHYSRIAITSLPMHEALNKNDKNVALEFSGPKSMEAGFVSAYEGVLTKTNTINGTPLFKLSIFDISKGAERPEIFQVEASEEAATDNRPSISSLLRGLTRVPEDLKYGMDKLFKGTYTESTTKMLNYPSSTEQIADIINNKIISNMDLPPLFKRRIKAVESQPGTYALTIKNPPGIFAGPTYKKRVQEVENNIFKAVNAMFNA